MKEENIKSTLAFIERVLRNDDSVVFEMNRSEPDIYIDDSTNFISMSIYRNQAQRVLDHMATQTGMTAYDYTRIFGISTEMLDNRIELMHIQTKLNGKECADALIQAWEASHPDYIVNQYNIIHNINGLQFRIKRLPEELIIFYAGPKGDYLHSYKYVGELTEDLKDQACEDCIIEYTKKTMEMN